MTAIARLCMQPFGVLTDTCVDFSPGLTVVYGPNEAGKSTLLLALDAAVTGSPTRSVHGIAPSRLRLDITLAGTSGDPAAQVTYRRTPQGLLRYPDMAPGDEPWGWLAGNGSWLDVYGLNHEQLQGGGRSLFDGEGDLADVIFEAHEGFTARDLLDSLQRREGELFRKDGRSRSLIQETLKRIANLEDEIRRNTVDADQVERLSAAVRCATDDAEQARQDLRGARQDRERTEIDKHAWGDVHRAVALRRALADVEQAGIMPADDVRSARAAEEAERDRGALIDELQQTIQQLDTDIAASPAQDAVLADANEVAWIHQNLTASLNDRDSAARASAKVDGLAADARERLAAVGVLPVSEDPGAVYAACLDVRLAEDVVASLDVANTRYEHVRREWDAAQRDLDAQERTLAEHEHAHPVASEAEAPTGVADAREVREDAWAAVREALLDPSLTTVEARRDLARRMERAVADADAAADAAIVRARTDATRAGLASNVRLARAKAARAREALETAEVTWTDLAGRAGLPAALTPAGWSTRRDLIERVGALADAWNREQQAASSHQQRWEEFAGRVQRAAARHAVTGTPEQQARALHERLDAAQQDQRTLATNRQRRTDAQQSLATAQRELQAAEETVAALADNYALADRGELQVRLAASEEYYQMAEELRDVTGRLMAAYRQSAEAVHGAIERLEPLTQEDVDAELDAAKARERDAEEIHHNRRDDLLGAQRVLREAEAADQEVIRAQALRNAQAELVEYAEEFALTVVQARLLEQHLEQLFQQRGSTTLIRAGEIVEQLTGGRFVALASAEDPSGRRSLRVLRSDQVGCSLDELSEGTADQVFLALRLAGLEARHDQDRAVGRTPPPVVLDDVLLAFDDARTERALAVLAEWGRDRQVIVTTHHHRVRDAAQAHGIACTDLGDPAAVEILGSSGTLRQHAAVPNRGHPRTVDMARPPSDDTSDVPASQMRAWAEGEGLIAPGIRGRLPNRIQDLFREAHS